MQNETEKQYNELSKKHKLPNFKEIDSEFEISDLEKTNFLLRAIIRKINEKLDFYSTLMESVLQPDTSNIYSMHETRFFDDEEKKQLYDLYRVLMDINRQSIAAFLDHEKEVEFINSFFNKWKDIKEELLACVVKMQASWKSEDNIKEDVGYLG